MVPPMTSVAVSPSRLIRTWSPWNSTTEASVTCGRPRRSASIAGTTLIPASVEARPPTTRSTGVSAPIFSMALASTREVAAASDPAMASSITWTPLSAPICSALRTASRAFSGPTQSAVTVVSSPAFSLICRDCSTPYSSSSDSRPSTPTRSTVLSDSNCRSAVASGTYFTQTTMFMVVWPGRPLLMRSGCGREATVAYDGPKLVPGSDSSQRRCHGSDRMSGTDDPLQDPADDEVGDRTEAPVGQRALGRGILTVEGEDAVVAREDVEVDRVGHVEDQFDQGVVLVGVEGDQQRADG